MRASSTSCWRGVNRLGLEADAAQQQVAPLLEREVRSAGDERVEGVARRHLDRPHRLDPERLPARLLAERGDVLEGDLGVEAAGEHPVVLVDQLVGDVDVAELEAGQLGLVGVGLGVEPGPEQVDDLDPALLAGARLEQLLLAGADGPLLHRALDDRETLGDLVRVGRGAVPAEQELADVGRHRVLAAELLGEVLADEVALEDLGGELVELVELGHRFLPTITSRWARICRRRGDEHEVGALALVLLVGHDQRDLAGAESSPSPPRRCSCSASPGSARRSTMTPSATPVNSIRHSRPSHLIFVISGPPVGCRRLRRRSR